jgi:hypothetical protein
MDRALSEPTIIIKLKLLCLNADECTVYFEPFGAYHQLSSDDHFDVTISGQGSGDVEVAYRPEGITLWIWGGATYQIVNSEGTRLFV